MTTPVRTIPQATPAATTSSEAVEEEAEDRSSVDLEPVTALESVTPERQKKKNMAKKMQIWKASVLAESHFKKIIRQ